jgi:hypothetical protein
MPKMVKFADDMIRKFTAKTTLERVATRYGASKEHAILMYAANGIAAREAIETVRSILSARGVPSGTWGVYIAFGLKLWSLARTYAGKVPAAVVEGFKKEYATKGGDPAILDAIAGVFVGGR